MNKPSDKLIYESSSLTNLLFEQEDDLFAADEEDEGGDEEATGEEGGDEGEEEEATGEDEEGGEDEGTEEETLDVDVEEEVKLSKSIDQDLEALLIDFEAASRKSKQISDEEVTAAEEEVMEARLNLSMLLEQDELPDYQEQIDIDRFASEVARLVKNYTTLLDMEKMLVSKAREFIVTRYGQDAESAMLDVLDSQHDISIEEPPSPAAGEQAPPIAVGAGSGATGGTA